MKKLSYISSRVIIIKEILYFAKVLLFSAERRDRIVVNTNYDAGVWQSKLEEKKWTKFNTPYDYLTKSGENFRLNCVINNTICNAPYSYYYEHRLKIVQSIVSTWANDHDEIIELGSGFGMNLLSLVIMQKWKLLKGYELSPTGIKCANELFAHFKIENCHFLPADLTNENDNVYNSLEGKLCFTYLCLEQLKYNTGSIINSLIKSNVKRVIHIEPSFELLNPLNLRDLLSIIYVKCKDYQDNLLKTLRKYSDEGKIKILAAERLGYSPTLKNSPTLIVWEPII